MVTPPGDIPGAADWRAAKARGDRPMRPGDEATEVVCGCGSVAVAPWAVERRLARPCEECGGVPRFGGRSLVLGEIGDGKLTARETRLVQIALTDEEMQVWRLLEAQFPYSALIDPEDDSTGAADG